MRHGYLLSTLLLVAATAHAGVIINGTRLVYQGGKKESSIENVLRVVRTGGNLPEDRESMFWLNIKAIPSSKKVAGVNTLQIAVNTRIKLMYRPASVKGKPEAVADQLEWHREGNDLVVNNPTPFYMNFQSVTLNGHKVDKATWAVPKTETHFALPAHTGGSTVSWSIITDYGSISKTLSASVH